MRIWIFLRKTIRIVKIAIIIKILNLLSGYVKENKLVQN